MFEPTSFKYFVIITHITDRNVLDNGGESLRRYPLQINGWRQIIWVLKGVIIIERYSKFESQKDGK